MIIVGSNLACVKILDISDAGVNRIREINTKTLLKTKPKDATFGKLGKKTLKETTEVLKKWMGREEGVAKKKYYEKIVIKKIFYLMLEN